MLISREGAVQGDYVENLLLAITYHGSHAVETKSNDFYIICQARRLRVVFDNFISLFYVGLTE